MAFAFDMKYMYYIKFQVTFFFMLIHLNIIICYINQLFLLLIVEFTYFLFLRIQGKKYSKKIQMSCLQSANDSDCFPVLPNKMKPLEYSSF